MNRLLGTRGLARTSSTPGRTQSVNFYRVNEAFHFVDLPGYGHASAPARIRETWGPMVDGFLERHRERIVSAILLIDARHTATKLDGVMRQWLEHNRIRYLVVATKSDKLSGNTRATAKRAIERDLAGSELAEGPIMTSSQTGLGIKEIWKHLDRALA